MTTKNFYSTYRNPKLIHRATLQLLEGNAELLLGYIYNTTHHTGLLGNPEIRIGLSIKLLNNLRGHLSTKLLDPILQDIDRLSKDENYLKSTGNKEARTKALEEEYKFVQNYMNIDDNITLNTDNETVYNKPTEKEEKEKEKPKIQKGGSEDESTASHVSTMEEQGCIIC
jgi:hypothetical protein